MKRHDDGQIGAACVRVQPSDTLVSLSSGAKLGRATVKKYYVLYIYMRAFILLLLLLLLLRCAGSCSAGAATK